MDSQFHKLGFQKRRFKALVDKTFGPEDKKKVLAAFAFAYARHQGQRRDEGTAYIIHPIRVANTLLEDAGSIDADVVAAAVLHDVVEDCRVRVRTIQKRFGKRAAHFVEALTSKRRPRESEAEKEARKTQKLARLKNAPMEVRLIKSADILDNLRCAADVPWWAWTPLARKKFPRWHREFHVAAAFAKEAHPALHGKVQKALRVFDFKRLARGMVWFGR